MAGSKNSTKPSNGGGGGGNKTGGKGKGKEGKKDAGDEGAKEGSGGKLKPATAINSRHILVSFLSFPPFPLPLLLHFSVCVWENFREKKDQKEDREESLPPFPSPLKKKIDRGYMIITREEPRKWI